MGSYELTKTLHRTNPTCRGGGRQGIERQQHHAFCFILRPENVCIQKKQCVSRKKKMPLLCGLAWQKCDLQKPKTFLCKPLVLQKPKTQTAQKRHIY